MLPPPPRASGAAVHASLRKLAVQNLQKESADGDPVVVAQRSEAIAGDDDGFPAPWQRYFDRQILVHCGSRGANFNVYQAGTAGPVLLCLHGGGYTGLSWALFAQLLKNRYRILAPDLRGHGLSLTTNDADLSVDTLAADVIAIWRSVLSSWEGQQPPADAHPSRDMPSSHTGEGRAGRAMAAAGAKPEVQGCSGPGGGGNPSSRTPVVLVGHSMGGAVAVRAAAKGEIQGLEGVVVIDVVEGTALASLPFMATVLRNRPQEFADLRQAAEWALSTGMCRRREATRVSLPAMLCKLDCHAVPAGSAAAPLEGPTLRKGCMGEPSDEEGGVTGGAAEALGGAPRDGAGGAGGCSGSAAATRADSRTRRAAPPRVTPSVGGPGGLQAVSEEGLGWGAEEGASVAALACEASYGAGRREGSVDGAHEGPGGGGKVGASDGEWPQGGSSSRGGWVWRTPLQRSDKYWDGWYRGLSETFLALKVPKVLILAGTDRLDRQLTIGQMQGRFQLVLLPQAGHAVHEDEPEKTAEAVGGFLRRFRVGEPPLQLPKAPPDLPRVLPIPAGPPA